jgi:ABC-type amino acid transport substrate-binding protein
MDMVGVAGVIGLWGGVAEIGGLPTGLMLTTGAATPGTKTFAFGFKTNSFAFGFRVDFFAAVADEVGVDEVAAGGVEAVLALLLGGDISGWETVIAFAVVSFSDFGLG